MYQLTTSLSQMTIISVLVILSLSQIDIPLRRSQTSGWEHFSKRHLTSSLDKLMKLKMEERNSGLM